MATQRERFAALIDHTMLDPAGTPGDVLALVAEAKELGVYCVCVSPSLLPLVEPGTLRVATVCGFPSGAHTPQVKAAEAAQAVARGAVEIDMVANLGLIKAGEFNELVAEINLVRQEAPLLKVILESAALSDEELVLACRAAEAGGADFVKTSTGFHKAGGASVHAVELMAATVGGRLGIKASGGIRTYETALALVNAGATRLGMSASASVLAEIPD